MTQSASVSPETAPVAAGAASVARWAPSIPAVVFLLLAILVPFGTQRTLLNSDGDLARHLAHGEWMLQHRALVLHDPFSFTRPGASFVPFEYGAQLILTLVHRAGGLAAVSILAGLLIAIAHTLQARLLLRRGVDPLLAVGTVMLAAVAGSIHWLARPHLFTWVFAVVLLSLLEEDKAATKLWVYPALFALWANIHGGWLYGLVLLGIYAVGHAAEYLFFGRNPRNRAAARHLALALPVAALATLVTPMGLDLWRHLYVHLRDSYVMNHTGEFASPNFHLFEPKVFLVLLLVAVGALALSRRRLSAPRLLLLLASTWWALTAQRNIPLFGLVALTVLALHLDGEWRTIAYHRLIRVRDRFAAGAESTSTGPWLAASVVILSALAVQHGRVAGRPLLQDRFDPAIFPVAAMGAARDAHLPGHVFTEFRWGGYQLYAWPEQPVFIDGGTDFYGGKLMAEFGQLEHAEPGWREVLNRWGIGTVIVNPRGRLAHEIVREPDWQQWHCDSTAVVLHRTLDRAPPDAAGALRHLDACGGPPEAD